MTTSLQGNRIAFTVVCRIGDNWHVRTYAANPDGSGVMDLTGNLPGTVAPATVSFLQLDNTGERLFFRAPNVGTVTNIFYCSLATQACTYAVMPKAGEEHALLNFDFRKPYSLTTLGSQIYLFFKHDAGWDNVLKRHNRGIYTAPLGGQASKMMDIDQLHGDQSLGSLHFLGSAAENTQNIFTWNQDYYNPPATGMYKVEGPTRIPNELHTYVWPAQDLFQHLISADGSRALYQLLDSGPRQLYAVDLATGAKTFLNQTVDLNGYFAPTLSPSGKYAFFSNLGNRRTRFDIATGDQRDTLAYHFTPYHCTSQSAISDITGDDRYYYMGSKCEGDVARVHRVDMDPKNFSKAPNITAIEFSAPVLIADGSTRITVMATVSDAQGLGTISRVRLQSLVDGLEKPEWMNVEPVSYDWTLFDDGTHGDEMAGDGIYTNDTLQTRLDSNFYQTFSLPRDIGIRVIAQDQDHNYVMADTLLTLANLFVSEENIRIRPGESVQVDVFGTGGPYTVSNSNPSAVAVTVDGSKIHITGLSAGSAKLTVRDGSANTILVTVQVVSQGGVAIPLLLLE